MHAEFNTGTNDKTESRSLLIRLTRACSTPCLPLVSTGAERQRMIPFERDPSLPTSLRQPVQSPFLREGNFSLSPGPGEIERGRFRIGVTMSRRIQWVNCSGDPVTSVTPGANKVAHESYSCNHPFGRPVQLRKGRNRRRHHRGRRTPPGVGNRRDTVRTTGGR